MQMDPEDEVQTNSITSERDLENLVCERVENVFLENCTYAGQHTIKENKYHGFIGIGNTPRAITIAYIKVGNVKVSGGKVDAIDGKDMWLAPHKEEDCPIIYNHLLDEITFL